EIEAQADLVRRQHGRLARDRRGRDIADRAVEIGDAAISADFLAPHRQILAVEAGAVEDAEIPARRHGHAPDNVRAAVVETGTQGELRTVLEAIAFTDQELRAARNRIEQTGMQAVIDALAAIDAVIARPAVADEEIGVIEFEALGILVGNVSGVAA